MSQKQLFLREETCQLGLRKSFDLKKFDIFCALLFFVMFCFISLKNVTEQKREASVNPTCHFKYSKNHGNDHFSGVFFDFSVEQTFRLSQRSSDGASAAPLFSPSFAN